MAFCMTLGVATMANPAFAESVHYQQKGESVDVYWHQGDECTSTFIGVYGTTSASKGGENPAPYSRVYVDTVNYCTGATIYSYGNGDPAAFQLSVQNINSAALKGTVNMQQCTFETNLPVDCENSVAEFDLQWKGNKDASLTSSISRRNSPTAISMIRTTGVIATAKVTGSFVVDNTPWIVGGTSQAALISTSTNGEIDIMKVDSP